MGSDFSQNSYLSNYLKRFRVFYAPFDFFGRPRDPIINIDLILVPFCCIIIIIHWDGLIRDSKTFALKFMLMYVFCFV